MNEHTRKVGIAADAVKMEGRSQAFFEFVEDELGWPHSATFREIREAEIAAEARVPERSDGGRVPSMWEGQLPDPPEIDDEFCAYRGCLHTDDSPGCGLVG